MSSEIVEKRMGYVHSTKVHEDLTGDPFATSWVQEIKNPFAVEGQDGAWTFFREPRDKDEEDLKLRILSHVFADLFQGNRKAHTRLEDGDYKKVDGAPSESTWNPIKVPPHAGGSGLGLRLDIGDYEIKTLRESNQVGH